MKTKLFFKQVKLETIFCIPLYPLIIRTREVSGLLFSDIAYIWSGVQSSAWSQ